MTLLTADILEQLPAGAVAAALGNFLSGVGREILCRDRIGKIFVVHRVDGIASEGKAEAPHLASPRWQEAHGSLELGLARQVRTFVTSDCAAWLQTQPDNSLDFLYVEGDRSYEMMSRQLREARRVVKPNGFIAGHNYSVDCPGVTRAVDEFLHRYPLQMAGTAADPAATFCILNLRTPLLILTGYDDAMARAGRIAEASWTAYARRHGYGFRCLHQSDYPAEFGHPSRQKLRWLRAMMAENWPMVFWADADSVVTNFDLALETWLSSAPLIASADWQPSSPWSAGHLLVQPMADSFLAAAQRHIQWKDCLLWDQSAMHYECQRDRRWRKTIWILPERAWNSVPRDCQPSATNPWQQGDFQAHFTCMANHEREPLMERYARDALGQ